MIFFYKGRVEFIVWIYLGYNYGLNWYVSDELKVMLNYVIAQPKDTDEYDGLLQIVQGRVLFAF